MQQKLMVVSRPDHITAARRQRIIRITITKLRTTAAMLSRLPTLFTKGMRYDSSTWPDEKTALHRHFKHRIYRR